MWMYIRERQSHEDENYFKKYMIIFMSEKFLYLQISGKISKFDSRAKGLET